LYIGDDFDWSVRVGPRGAVSSRGELNLSVVDREVQEDARRVEFTGNGEHLSQIYFQFEDPVNMRSIGGGGGRAVVRYTAPEKTHRTGIAENGLRFSLFGSDGHHVNSVCRPRYLIGKSSLSRWSALRSWAWIHQK